jgi:hypothetical protein
MIMSVKSKTTFLGKPVTKLASMLLLGCVISTATFAETVRLSEPVAVTETSETFGALIDENIRKVDLASLSKQPNEYIKKPFVVQTKIAKVCQKKGCFFIAQDGDTVIRVSFKDYGFFIPTDTAGRTVTLAGELVKKELSEEQAAHYRADLQLDSDIVKAGEVFEIVASGIMIPKA